MSEQFELATFFPYRLAVLSERVSRRLSEAYEKTHGLSVAEWRVMVHLDRRGHVSVREIRDWVNMDKPRVSRAVARLERAGLVRKDRHSQDARLVSISLTARGQSVLGDVLPRVLEIENQVLDGVGEEDLKVFYRVMERIHSGLDNDPEAKPRSRMDIVPSA